MQVNPDCPKCGTNRRVIVSHKRPQGTVFGHIIIAGDVKIFLCRECGEEFKGYMVDGYQKTE